MMEYPPDCAMQQLLYEQTLAEEQGGSLPVNTRRDCQACPSSAILRPLPTESGDLYPEALDAEGNVVGLCAPITEGILRSARVPRFPYTCLQLLSPAEIDAAVEAAEYAALCPYGNIIGEAKGEGEEIRTYLSCDRSVRMPRPGIVCVLGTCTLSLMSQLNHGDARLARAKNTALKDKMTSMRPDPAANHTDSTE